MDAALLLSRIQFASTAGFHFVFSGLTLGLSFIVAICETLYVLTKKESWKDATRFWGSIFGINFAIGAATGIPLTFQFGTNWAIYSRYVSDIFGPILALEGLVAFFAEATLLGIFFFAWDLIPKSIHLLCTWIIAFATSFSGFFIMVANSWMQNPIGSIFDPIASKMELVSFFDIVFNSFAQARFAHTIFSGYVYGSVFVIGICSYYLIKGLHSSFAKNSALIASVFGLVASIGLIFAGDESGYLGAKKQPMKIAALEAEWKTEKAPADFTLLALPNKNEKKNFYSVKIPKLLGIIATRSLDKTLPGIDDLTKENKQKIIKGLKAYGAAENLKLEENEHDRKTFKENEKFYGYALLLKKFVNGDILNVTEEIINVAAESIIPNVFVLFWAFRIMVGIGFYLMSFFLVTFILCLKNKIECYKKFLVISLINIPLPIIAIQLGWLIAEYGRQPWAIEGILPTFLAKSAVKSHQVGSVLFFFACIYSLLFVASITVLIKFVKKGPKIHERVF